MKSSYLTAALLAASVLASSASAQVTWASYDGSGNRLSANAGTFNAQDYSYTFTIPAGAYYTFVASHIVPITVAKPASTVNLATITFQQKATSGWTGTNTGNRAFCVGLFNYGSTAPAQVETQLRRWQQALSTSPTKAT